MYKYEGYSDPIQRPRYTGVPTFLRAPYEEELDNVDIALVGVPFVGGVTNRPGTWHGQRVIRNQSCLTRRMHQSSGISPHDFARVSDVGDAWV